MEFVLDGFRGADKHTDIASVPLLPCGDGKVAFFAEGAPEVYVVSGAQLSMMQAAPHLLPAYLSKRVSNTRPILHQQLLDMAKVSRFQLRVWSCSADLVEVSLGVSGNDLRE